MTKVVGKYHGVPFTGTIEAERFNTVDRDLRQVFVTLEQPIVVWGSSRTEIVIERSVNSQDRDTFVRAVS
jgi:hypothetical protein